MDKMRSELFTHLPPDEQSLSTWLRAIAEAIESCDQDTVAKARLVRITIDLDSGEVDIEASQAIRSHSIPAKGRQPAKQPPRARQILTGSDLGALANRIVNARPRSWPRTRLGSWRLSDIRSLTACWRASLWPRRGVLEAKNIPAGGLKARGG